MTRTYHENAFQQRDGQTSQCFISKSVFAYHKDAYHKIFHISMPDIFLWMFSVEKRKCNHELFKKVLKMYLGYFFPNNFQIQHNDWILRKPKKTEAFRWLLFLPKCMYATVR